MQPNATSPTEAQPSLKSLSRNDSDSNLTTFQFPRPGLRVPDVSGLSLYKSALAYANAGWFVLPVAPGTKNPGSVVGGSWQSQSSRQAEQIAAWWDENPDYGIALHVGRSGAVAFDLDSAALEEVPSNIADGLRQGVVQLSRRDDADRGHYLFRTDEPVGNGAGAFRPFGEVRGKNGVIIAEPTRHVREDGEYRWIAGESVLPKLPAALRECLSASSEVDPEPMNDAELAAFLNDPAHTRNTRPNAIKGPLQAFENDVRNGGSSHEALVQALPWAFREAAAGCYPATDALALLQDAFHESFEWEGRSPDGRSRPGPDEFYRTARWAAAHAKLADPADTLARLDRGKTRPDAKRFELVPASALAEPVPPMEWLIKGVWPRGSFGPMGGEKKTLKSYNLMSIALAVASGRPLFGEFEVTTPGPVVYYVGEGGRGPFMRRLQAIARSYDADLADLPIYAVFDVGPLDAPEFTTALTAALDDVRPELVIIDPLYAFHPAGIEAQNLYERGRMLAGLSGLVAGKAALIIADHFKKSGGADLDLDSISQAGMGQWADSWILQKHREKADLDNGAYRLAVEFGSRQWGGSRWDVDWQLPAFGDLDDGDAETAAVSVTVARAGGGSGSASSGRRDDKAARRRAIVDLVRDNDFVFTESALAKTVGGNAGAARDLITELLTTRTLVVENRAASERGRMVKRDRVGIGPGFQFSVERKATENA
ncbi:AAA family ATPase [Gordonia sp. LUNF6]|uniref:AAA family ATPase n=1 Tax=Gordonia sp. LUNF6 TaxID=3388658 RepID=UPI00399A6209